MKFNKIILPAVALATVMSACDDQIMEWQEKDNTVTPGDLPLQLQEQIDNYDFIKNYAAQYHPNLQVNVGVGADLYVSDADYRKVVNDNFTGITLGNAMKHGVAVSATGKVNFETIDAVLALLPSNMKLYGHNFIWHTQQNQTYLKSLIAPEMKVEVSGGVANMLGGDSNNFDGGTTGGWGSWGSNKEAGGVEDGAGPDGSPALMLQPKGDGNYWEAQCAYTFDTFLDPETTYVIKFKGKTSAPGGSLQFQYQNGTTYGSQGAYTEFALTTEWADYQADVTVNYEDVNRIILNFGKVGATYWVDDIEFGPKVEGPQNFCENGNFADGTNGWILNNGAAGMSIVAGDGNPSGNANMLKVVVGDGTSNYWDSQFQTEIPSMEDNKWDISFYIKSDQPGKIRLSFPGLSNEWPWLPWLNPSGSWSEAFETVADQWILVSLSDFFHYGDNAVKEGNNSFKISFDMGVVPGVTYYIDDVKVTKHEEAAASAPRKAGGVSYILKTPEEKRAILLGAMEEWIKTMAEHMGDRVDAWDVVNEPIADGSNGWRGIDGVFGANNGDEDNPVDDSTPEESTESGLNLNWSTSAGNQHFYWGYYIGKDYAAQAFKFARQYAPNAKLFVNDYNLEVSPSKLDALIGFVEYIDANGGHVDGIGTQMHVNAKSLTREQVDAMFTKMASTGKLVRVTEFDASLGSANPSAEELMQQYDCYKMVLESYFANVPEAQQCAITIWTLTDHKREHEYWLPDSSPNLFNADYSRKPAYKGVCDALAGKDIGAEFPGDAWKDLHKPAPEEPETTPDAPAAE